MDFICNETRPLITSPLITFCTCWYNVKSKFDNKLYRQWIKNFLSIINNFNVVLYTNKESLRQIFTLIDPTNKRIKIIIKPFEEFYMYKYEKQWIKNHEESGLDLHSKTDWKLNMIWNEKVFFVKEAIQNGYFDTPFYGWCDIGYFRGRQKDLPINQLFGWPNTNKLINMLKDGKIHYGCVQNNKNEYAKVLVDIKNHYKFDWCVQPTNKYETIMFAGGFFACNKNAIENYAIIYDGKIQYYLDNSFTVKDDQTILTDIIVTNPMLFSIHLEQNKYDNWFMFQRLLL